MGYLVRKADAFLREWKKNPDRKPLIIKGARQVGKTETIRTFARENYKNVIEINFITEPSYKVIVEEGFSAEHIIKLISRIDPTKHFEENETLIFFDEIQDFPEIATALKFFKENGKYDVICSGSLLGVQYQRIASISVGYKTDYQMYSMDFEEFLWAKGYSEEAISDMLCHMLEGVAFSEAEQVIFSNLFLEYCILGGMPAIVSSYIERETFEGSLDLQHQLLVDYENDIVKYAQGLDKAKILSVYRSIPAQLAKENKKFQYSILSKNARGKTHSSAIQWLSDYGLVNISYNLMNLQLPLKGNRDDSVFKVYMADTGLFVSMLDRGIYSNILSGDMHTYKGAVFENVISDILNKNGVRLYYYHKDSGLEVDFISVHSGKVCLIEVKSHTGNTKSAKVVMSDKKNQDVDLCFKLGDYNVGFMNGILTLPMYMAPLMAAELSDE